MGSILQDVRFAARTLAKSPGFIIIAILTLALGIGANTALFSVVNGVLLNPLPYPDPDKLVAVFASTKEFEHSSVTYMNYLDWEKYNQSFEHLGIFRNEDEFLIGAGEGERVRAYMVSASFFPALGIQPKLGGCCGRKKTASAGRP